MTDPKIPQDVMEAVASIGHAQDIITEAVATIRDPDVLAVLNDIGDALPSTSLLLSDIARHLPGTCGGCRYEATCAPNGCAHYTPADRGEGKQDG
jgi:hypothetical protein